MKDYTTDVYDDSGNKYIAAIYNGHNASVILDMIKTAGYHIRKIIMDNGKMTIMMKHDVDISLCTRKWVVCNEFGILIVPYDDFALNYRIIDNH